MYKACYPRKPLVILTRMVLDPTVTTYHALYPSLPYEYFVPRVVHETTINLTKKTTITTKYKHTYKT